MRSLMVLALSVLLCVAQSRAQRMMDVWTSKATYEYGETIQVLLRVWNPGDSAFTISSSTTCVAWIRPDTVVYSMFCGEMETHIVFNPGDSRTWIWNIVPSEFGYPTFSGRHIVWGICAGLDSACFDAPEYRGGPLSVSFDSTVDQSVVDSIRISIDAALTWHHASISGISERWTVAGFQVDSLAEFFSHDDRFRYALVPRTLAPDTVLVVGVPRDPATVTDFRLDENYPNPFNPSTTISYTLSEQTTVRLAIFDMLGRLVANLVNEAQQKGNYKVVFDGGSLASGVYICWIAAGKQVVTSKMLLIR